MIVLTQFTVLGSHFKWQEFSVDPDPGKHPHESQWASWNNNLVYDNWIYLNTSIIFDKGWKADSLCSPVMDPEKFWVWRRKVKVLKCPFQLQAFWWLPTALSGWSEHITVQNSCDSFSKTSKVGKGKFLFPQIFSWGYHNQKCSIGLIKHILGETIFCLRHMELSSLDATSRLCRFLPTDLA